MEKLFKFSECQLQEKQLGRIYGGGTQQSHSESTEATNGCTETRTTTTDDGGKTIRTCTYIECPD